MPKIFLSNRQKLNNRLTEWVIGKMYSTGTTQTIVANALGIQQQAVSRKLKLKTFNFGDFTALVELFNPDIDEILWLLGKGSKG